MSGHTPGPWRVDPNFPFDIETEDGIQIASVDSESDKCADGYRSVEKDEEAEANARLIAAAPELLEALIDARKQLEAYEEALNGEDYNSPRINEAIAKATGAQS